MTAKIIARHWRGSQTRKNLKDLVENTRKWINFPSVQQVDTFLRLTNGQERACQVRGKNSAANQVDAFMAQAEDAGVASGKRISSRHTSFVMKEPSSSEGSKKSGKNQVVPEHVVTPNIAPWCGKFEADGDGTDVWYMTVNVPPKGQAADIHNSYNPHLIRFYMEHVWKLKRPDVIITVTGGAMDFDLSTEEKDTIMKAMMDGTRALDAWFITGRNS